MCGHAEARVSGHARTGHVACRVHAARTPSALAPAAAPLQPRRRRPRAGAFASSKRLASSTSARSGSTWPSAPTCPSVSSSCQHRTSRSLLARGARCMRVCSMCLRVCVRSHACAFGRRSHARGTSARASVRARRCARMRMRVGKCPCPTVCTLAPAPSHHAIAGLLTSLAATWTSGSRARTSWPSRGLL